MNAKTLTALQESIKKWEGIVAGTGIDVGDENCPLCLLFIHQTEECRGCPVAKKAKNTLCMDTPYIAWQKQQMDRPFGSRWMATTPELVALAQAELDFLKSLLPKE